MKRLDLEQQPKKMPEKIGSRVKIKDLLKDIAQEEKAKRIPKKDILSMDAELWNKIRRIASENAIAKSHLVERILQAALKDF